MEKMRSLSNNHARGKCVCFIVFDLTEPNTFVIEGEKLKGVQYWYEQYNINVSEHMIRILIGNKADLVDRRKVTKE